VLRLLSAPACQPHARRVPPQFAALQNKTSQLRSAIQAHRDTWVTEADIAFLASIGMNCVRLPVGYWVLAQTQVRSEVLPGQRMCPHPARASPPSSWQAGGACRVHTSIARSAICVKLCIRMTCFPAVRLLI